MLSVLSSSLPKPTLTSMRGGGWVDVTAGKTLAVSKRKSKLMVVPMRNFGGGAPALGTGSCLQPASVMKDWVLWMTRVSR